MKHISITALAIAAIMMAGCTNGYDDMMPQQPGQQAQSANRVVTLTTTVGFDGNAQTRSLYDDGLKIFAIGDKIAVAYQNTSGEMVKQEVTLALADIKNNGKYARLTITATNPQSDGKLRIVYPASMANDDGTVDMNQIYNEQDGTLATFGNKYDVAAYDGKLDGAALPKNAPLTNQLAVCNFTIKDDGNAFITNSITKLTIKNGKDVYHVVTSNLNNIWVGIKPITSGDIEVYAAKRKELYRKKVTSNTSLAANTITPINIKVSLIEGATSGLFTANEDGDLIYFSRGNLTTMYISNWDNWSFADKQYGYIGQAPGNTCIDIDDRYYGCVVDLFGWSTNANTNYFGVNVSDEDETYMGDFYDWGIANIRNGGGRNKWRTPSATEFTHMLFQRSGTTINGVSNARFVRAYIGDRKTGGLILFPDHYVHPDELKLPGSQFINNRAHSEADGAGTYDLYTTYEWLQMEAAGAVFLPAAGLRVGSEVAVRYYGQRQGYHTSSIYAGVYVWTMGTDLRRLGSSTECSFETGIWEKNRHVGCSVRLIGPVEQ